MNAVSFKQLNNILRSYANDNIFINDYGFGQISEIGTTRQMKFPYLWGTTTSSHNYLLNENNTFVKVWNITLLFVDQVSNIKIDKIENGLASSNAEDIINQMELCAEKFVTYIQKDIKQFIRIQGNPSIEFIYDETTDKVYGVRLDIALKSVVTNCEIPF